MTCTTLHAGALRPARLAGLCVLVTMGVAAPFMASAQDSFFDDFDRLDRKRWYVSDGWTNGAHQACWWSSRAIDIRDSHLVLSLQSSDDPDQPYICGEVQTQKRFRHGTFEARFRTDNASGVNAAFFTYIGEVHKKPHDEIDVEVLTRDPGRVEFNTFIDGKMRNGGAAELPQPADAVFHHYAFIWDETRVRWYVDGELVHEASAEGMTDAQKIYFSHWNTNTLTEWMGNFNDPRRPLEMHVDWVAWTAPGEDCQFEQSILCDKDAE
ncbi:family 16 glycosylhydrolase [Loktanella sp. SALINAS62]|uniref:family 16 glycosylhydrolase n=1 Tax=Loktanella sp. SALINAS62 TaxID=2706124 RepID=UPI001B8B179B|nr:family 16 glycosylhydrolase [Loktanella sp. SALINAS62]MBS1302159.1 family 16 glycosylhydrolase [Loktanella sp. SALINAS62]